MTVAGISRMDLGKIASYPMKLGADAAGWWLEVDKRTRTLDGNVDLRYASQAPTILRRTDVEIFVTSKLRKLTTDLPALCETLTFLLEDADFDTELHGLMVTLNRQSPIFRAFVWTEIGGVHTIVRGSDAGVELRAIVEKLESLPDLGEQMHRGLAAAALKGTAGGSS
jgi:hypothetical protein